MVVITNTVKAPLEALHKQWGGSMYLDHSRGPRWRDKWQWTICSRNALPFLEAILPHLLIKREVAEQAIEMCRLMALPHKERIDYSRTVRRHGRLWSSPRVRPEFAAKIRKIHNKIRELNCRTPNARRKYDLPNAGESTASAQAHGA